jgi:hypothetical protein
MTKPLKPRRIRVPVRYVDGIWECALGGAVPVKSGADPETLLAELDAAEAETARLRDQLKAILAEALAR